MAKEKLYWEVERAGNGWNDWFDCTCPACKKKRERYDPSRYCPDCGVKLAGYTETSSYTKSCGPLGIARSVTTTVHEFDNQGRLHLVKTEREERVEPYGRG